MDPAKQREIARKGGLSVPAEKRSFSQNRELAVAAGAKGGKNLQGSKRSFSVNRRLASIAGKKGGSTKTVSGVPQDSPQLSLPVPKP